MEPIILHSSSDNQEVPFQGRHGSIPLLAVRKQAGKTHIFDFDVGRWHARTSSGGFVDTLMGTSVGGWMGHWQRNDCETGNEGRMKMSVE
jgi:hypothetical protein